MADNQTKRKYFPWSTEQKIWLRKMWITGISATDIGAHFGVSRNAVLGQVRRLGIHRYQLANRA